MAIALKGGETELRVVRTVADLRRQVGIWRAGGEEVGLVPTMGALHEGHLALVGKALEENRRVVATLFVNPKQFDRPDDLARYPRGEARDQDLLQQAGADLLFAPDVDEMYPEGFATKVTVEGLTDCLCGAHRPGHFDGVATVVSKLLLQALPDRAYFGEKDYQQLQIIRRMASDVNIPVDIRGVPTVREADGLALSSRNLNLSAEQRAAAPKLAEVLGALAEELADGRTVAKPLLAEGHEALTRAGFDKVDYLDLRDARDLRALDRADRPARVFGAAWLGQTRLIDNMPVG